MSKPNARRSTSQNNTPLIVGTVVVAGLVGLAIFSGPGKNNQAQANGSTENFAALNLSTKPTIGQESAPVEMVVIEDFKCPICKQFEANVYNRIEADYVHSGQLKVRPVTWPFLAQAFGLPEDDSKNAAQAAECVYKHGGATPLNEYRSIVFRAQGEEDKVWATKNRLKELAQNVGGIDQAAFATCLDNNETAAQVEANKAEVEAAGVRGTPTVFINGQKVNNPNNYAEIEAAIKAAAAGGSHGAHSAGHSQ